MEKLTTRISCASFPFVWTLRGAGSVQSRPREEEARDERRLCEETRKKSRLMYVNVSVALAQGRRLDHR